jgi:hypothetical protein
MVFGSAVHIVIPGLPHYHMRTLRDIRKYSELISYNCECGGNIEIWFTGLCNRDNPPPPRTNTSGTEPMNMNLVGFVKMGVSPKSKVNENKS